MDTLIGIGVLVLPFFLISRWRDIRLGTICILTVFILFHLIIAIVTQALGVFRYEIVLTLSTVFGVLGLVLSDWKRIRSIRVGHVRSIDWLFLGVIVVAFLHLFFTHFRYHGAAAILYPPYKEQVTNFQYPYPYYADEWYAVSLAQDAIKNNSLPVYNPLVKARPHFTNLELAFHSFLAELFLITRVEPLIGYVPLTIVVNLLIVLLLYITARTSSCSKTSSAIAALSVLYVTTGGNLPGLWYLIPLNVGMVSLLCTLYLLWNNRPRFALLSSVLTLILYPPLIIFIVAGAIGWAVTSLKHQTIPRKELYRFGLIGGFAIFAGALCISLFFLISGGKGDTYISYILLTKVLYQTFTKNALPQYMIWNIIPLISLFLAIVGLRRLQTKHLWGIVVPILTGLVFWLCYSFSFYRVIIEYERVIFVTSMLLAIPIGVGVDTLLDWFDRNHLWNSRFDRYLSLAVVVVGIVLSFTYTARNNWEKLTLHDLNTNRYLIPTAPVTNYLSPDDLNIFSSYTGKKFLSDPWKGTVIGVATNNYPVTIKPGTITINPTLFYTFMNSSCEQKEAIVRERNIDIVFVPPIDCPHFLSEGFSSEGYGVYTLQK